MKASGYFVTGTDTEVGKTLIASALIFNMKENTANLKVSGFKPVVAGTYPNETGQTCNEDLLSLIAASGLKQSQTDICPHILDTPAAPHLVAKEMGLQLSVASIFTALEPLLTQFNTVVVEGAGGFLVPLNEEESLADFASALGWPVILVVGLRLGCLNHAMCTLEAIERRGLKVAGWVANTLEPHMRYQDANLQDLQKRIKSPFLGCVPHLPKELQKHSHAPYSLPAIAWCSKHLNLSAL